MTHPLFRHRLALLALRAVARLPLPVLHWIGAVAGRIAFAFSPKLRERMLDNIRVSGVAGPGEAALLRFGRDCARELGRGLLEVLPFWCGRTKEMLARIRTDSSWVAARTMVTAGRGVIFLSPHVGCFEAAGQFLSEDLPITIMYREPRLTWLNPLLRAGRTRGKAHVIAADSRGVRALLKALRHGDPIGLLPDQVPVQGGGVMADFFGRPAYTTTLVGKLQKSTGAAIFLICAERLPRAQGYALTFHPLETLPEDDRAAAQALNRAVEAIIRRCPEQYLWTYNRYKQPTPAAGT